VPELRDPNGKYRHKVEYNKKGRHPYKRKPKFIDNLEDDEDYEVGLTGSECRRYYNCDDDEQ
jgi:hypothetical protein